MKILHGFTGSVATVLHEKFEACYEQLGEVKYVSTKGAKPFFQSSVDYYDDEDEEEYYRFDERVLHIDLVKWADVLVIAPCSATTLAKIANGICDNLLTCICRAWDWDKPMVLALAMNTRMWEHPITRQHIQTVESWGIQIAHPISKTLFCKDEGMGAMARIGDILDIVAKPDPSVNSPYEEI